MKNKSKPILIRRLPLWSVAVLLSALLVASSTALAADPIKAGETLNMDRCIEIALGSHPSILAADSSIKAGLGRVGQAKANYYPQVNWTSGYSRIAPYSAGFNGSSNTYDQYSSSVNLTQNIYDFGKTATQVQIQNLGVDSSRADLVNTRAQVILNVQQAYFGLLQTGKNRETSVEAVKQFEAHLNQARAFFEIGTKPKMDVTKAEVDLSNAKLAHLKAENALRLARVSLINALGITGAPDFSVEDNLQVRRLDVPLADALAKAFENRPDLRALRAKREAAERSVELSRKSYFPVITGNAGYGWSAQEFPLDRGWNVGAFINIPLFSGFSTGYQIDEARANVEIAKSNEDLLRQTIRLEVQQALLNLRSALDEIETAELTVRQAQENYELATGRYGAGVGNPLEVTDALVTLSNAKYTYHAALYSYHIAVAALEKAAGRKP